MNDQTVFVTFPGSSTLDFTTIQAVPVYEPAERGWMNYTVDANTITTISENGDVERTWIDTGRIERWYTRPTLQNVVTMAMKHKIGGYYFQFHANGSITTSSKEGTYYWGPVVNVKKTGCPMGTARPEFVTWEYLLGVHFKTTDPIEILNEEIAEWWDRQTDKRWRRTTSLKEEMRCDQMWLDDMKQRMANDPRIYNNPCVREAYETQIAKIERDVLSNQSLEDEKCPECRRAGVCMCYT